MANSKKIKILTIGHSTYTLNQLIEMLQAHGVATLIDIRTIPKSKHNPQFNRESLVTDLPQAGIGYLHMKELGGLRHAAKDSINVGLKNSSFRGYADYMQTSEFSRAIDELIEFASEKTIAIMCAEGNPYRCHRSLVADALTVRGIEVRHISSRKSASLHSLTPFAHVEGTKITYPGEG